jgi:DNA-3-methyladenine glycosylase I
MLSTMVSIMYAYHIPSRKRPKSDDGYFEVIAQSVFQAGFSWEVVRRKWPNFRRAFQNFRIARVARMTPRDATRLMRDPGIIRNSAKIMAVIENARIMRNLQKEHGSFKEFIQSIRKLPYAKRRALLAKTFRWIGPTGAFHFFWCVGENVPEWEERRR